MRGSFLTMKVILLTGEWGREGEEWKWTRSQAHNDKVSGLWGSRTSPAEGAQESHCQIKVSQTTPSTLVFCRLF